MEAFKDLGTFEPLDDVFADERRLPFARASSRSPEEMHNARGLVVAVFLSAACWAAIALALLV